MPADSRYTEHMDFQINFVCTVRSIFPERFLYTKFISDKRNSDAVFVSTGRDCVFVYVFSMFKISEQRAGGLNGSVFTQGIF